MCFPDAPRRCYATKPWSQARQASRDFCWSKRGSLRDELFDEELSLKLLSLQRLEPDEVETFFEELRESMVQRDGTRFYSMVDVSIQDISMIDVFLA